MCTPLHLPTLQCCYSPDEKYVLTGTSAERKEDQGAVVVLSADTLEKVGEVAVEGSAVAVQVGAARCVHAVVYVGLHASGKVATEGSVWQGR